jgi:hypothetical protein
MRYSKKISKIEKISSIFQSKTKLIEGGGENSWEKLFILTDGPKKMGK